LYCFAFGGAFLNVKSDNAIRYPYNGGIFMGAF